MKKRIIYIIIISVIVLSVVIGVISRNRSKLAEVTAYTVIAEDFKREVSANGEIVSKESLQMASTVSGRVIAVHVETGDYVEEGTLLVQLDTEEIDLRKQNLEATLESTRIMVRKELSSLRSAFVQAGTTFDQAEREYLRSENFKKEFTSEVEIQSKKDAYHIAQDSLASAMERLRFREGREPDDAEEDSRTDEEIVDSSPEVKQALLSLESIETEIKNYTFKSGISGIVTSLNVEKGEVVSPGIHVTSIHDDSRLEVISNIDEVDLSYLSVGQEVKIESDSFIGTELKGKVVKIAPVIRKIGDSRVCEIRVSILENPGYVAKIGASCSIFIVVENKIGRSAVPVESYFIEDGKKYVYLLEPGEEQDIYTAVKHEIKTGILGIDTVEVTEGLDIDDLVMNSDRTGVLDGDEVEIAEPEVGDEEDGSEQKDDQ